MQGMEKLGSVQIDKRFCGPPGFGNGGYVCGLLAQYVKGLQEDEAPLIRLHEPVPLERTLDVCRHANSSLQLQHEGKTVATCQRSKLNLQVPPCLDYSQAEQAANSCRGLHYHPFPECFVCGPQRLSGDGLRIFPGRLPSGFFDAEINADFHNLVAAIWVPDTSLVSESQSKKSPGAVAPEFVYAALDCTGSFAIDFSADKVLVLGQFKIRLLSPVFTGEQCVVMGWLKSIDGRKHFTETVIYNEDKEVCGFAEAIWIQLQN